MKVLLPFLAPFIVFTYVAVLIFGIRQTHCAYLVQVKSKPGVYVCSEQPRVKAKP